MMPVSASQKSSSMMADFPPPTHPASCPQSLGLSVQTLVVPALTAMGSVPMPPLLFPVQRTPPTQGKSWALQGRQLQRSALLGWEAAKPSWCIGASRAPTSP